jgi:hypothetical protein
MPTMKLSLRFPLALAVSAMLAVGCGPAEEDIQPQAELDNEEMIANDINNLSTGNAIEWFKVRMSLLKYYDINKAYADGYVRSGACYEGKGVHFINIPLIFGSDSVTSSNPYTPEVLMYVPDSKGNWRLVAAEYAQADVGQPHPSILGKAFDGSMPGHVPGEPQHYDVHVWMFQYNPNGFFAGLNPYVKCPQL